jgi:hypothetical protein
MERSVHKIRRSDSKFVVKKQVSEPARLRMKSSHDAINNTQGVRRIT